MIGSGKDLASRKLNRFRRDAPKDNAVPAPKPQAGFTFIYALIDSFNGAVRYVGKADHPAVRLRYHMLCITSDKYSFNAHRSNWLRSLHSRGATPVLRVLDIADHQSWKQREIAWIALFRERGENLTNATEGGDGSNPTPEVRARRREYMTGRPIPQDVRAKISAANKGRVVSAESRAKMSAVHKGRPGVPWTEMHREKMMAALAKRELTPEQRERLVARNKSYWLDKGYGPAKLICACAFCGKEFERKSKQARRKKGPEQFCSTECWYGHCRGATSTEDNSKDLLLIEIPCSFCGVTLKRSKNRIARYKTGMAFAMHRIAQHTLRVRVGTTQ